MPHDRVLGRLKDDADRGRFQVFSLSKVKTASEETKTVAKQLAQGLELRSCDQAPQRMRRVRSIVNRKFGPATYDLGVVFGFVT